MKPRKENRDAIKISLSSIPTTPKTRSKIKVSLHLDGASLGIVV